MGFAGWFSGSSLELGWGWLIVAGFGWLWIGLGWASVSALGVGLYGPESALDGRGSALDGPESALDGPARPSGVRCVTRSNPILC